ncbi:hypothetical protein SAMN05660330_01938 [Desulforhopalus singaporensis]|uniref:Uncharacterized protein n=1 Tax=Desulforhopalus singaporensis TaxID=91360 RepID=A0A1H0QDT6_9BACT|nr:hypothetical protein SAMN05660330_01938 [Desulforhopalus singaporensis]
MWIAERKTGIIGNLLLYCISNLPVKFIFFDPNRFFLTFCRSALPKKADSSTVKNDPSFDTAPLTVSPKYQNIPGKIVVRHPPRKVLVNGHPLRNHLLEQNNGKKTGF